MLLVFAVLCLQLEITYVRSWPIGKLKVFDEPCKYKDIILNDCIWCKCTQQRFYKCEQRPCTGHDPFGHFKDAIADIEVGMEGHGSWRTKQTQCEPGVGYRMGSLLCICDIEGSWPSDNCSKEYQYLYNVIKLDIITVTGNEKCKANLLYQVECNVCVCPESEHLSQALCTNKKCEKDDPAVAERPDVEQVKDVASEIYTRCEINKEYLFGSRTCVCLRNNRLLCNNGSEPVEGERSYCDGHDTDEIFYNECNSCQCDADSNMYCTARKCLKQGATVMMNIINAKYKQPQEHADVCASNKYESGCRSCKCIRSANGENLIDCPARCHQELTIHDDCVKSTLYELDCQVCFCYEKLGEKRQLCVGNPACRDEIAFTEKRSKDLQTMHGYCEPLHVYNMDCNVCQCLVGGKTLKCSSKNCAAEKSITIDSMIPVRVKNPVHCPKGHSYQVECNICFCLLNGNSICTTLDCRKNSTSF